MKSEWPRGSEWRKWDLHLHAPGTKLNDQFKVSNPSEDIWDEYCRRLDQSDVQVFGITDYFSADGYFTTITNFRQRFPTSDKVFLCNIELRISEVVNKAREEVNLHLLFNTLRPDHETKIRRFLQCLNTTKTEAGGRHVTALELSSVRQFKSATTTREFIREALEATFGRDVDLIDYLLIIAAANNDGIRAERGNMRKHQISGEIDKFSHCFFGNTKNVHYFLDPERGEDEKEDFEKKPVLSGCDAHSLADLDAKLGQIQSNSNGIVFQPTWIKSDPTFEGLKQIIFEPTNRVYIGEEPEIRHRIRSHQTKYIDRLDVTNIDSYTGHNGSWFRSEEILIGKELVAIIGNKGSGKSAVTDIIGLLGNSHNHTLDNSTRNKEEMFSFLNTEKFLKRGLAGNFGGALLWNDGAKDEKLLSDITDRNLPAKVEYLPQKYLERICANIADDEFRRTLNDVVFRYVAPAERYAQSSLDELINYLTQQAEAEIRNSKRQLHLANEAVVSIEKKLISDYRQKVEQKIRLKRQELAAHVLARPEEKDKPAKEDSTADKTTEIEQLTQKIAECSEAVAALKSEKAHVLRRIEELVQVRQAIERETGKLILLRSQVDAILKSARLSFDDIVKLELDYSGLDQVVAENKERLNDIQGFLATEQDIVRERGGQQGNENTVSAAKSRSIVCTKSNLERQKAQLVERQDKPAREYQEYLTRLATWISDEKEIRGENQNPDDDSLLGLERELANIKSVYSGHLREAKLRRARISKELFQKKRVLTHVYDQIKQSIDEEIRKFQVDLGDYSISIEAGLRFDPSFYDTFLNFINQGRKGSFHGSDEGRDMLHQFCDVVDDWESEEQVLLALHQIVDALHVDNRSAPDKGQARDVLTQMKNQVNPVVDLYDYVFGFDYLNPKYDLKVDQKDLSELSPGERGGLLLIFYLVLDKQDTPLIIDQPEDNLDNKSVYEILVRFIKQAKKRRQIILVTHNPNLAVVSDAEQIIHVSIDKKNDKYDFDYYSGSIEAPRINRAVVDILEGTLPAFDNRRLKYRRPK